ncbi:MAG: YraN family protein [Muribaculaceae bacterium]|nr:YraN family protein [Muribaculaceae bacterium]
MQAANKKQLGKYAREWGDIAEDIASNYLAGLGLPVLERKWSPRGGHKEIDIICQQGDTIIFVEVKARSGRDESPLDAINRKKMNNIFRCADSYLRTLPGTHWQYRFDIITLEGTPENYTLQHIEDAFLGPLISYR